MGDNKNNVNWFPLATFVFIPFDYGICCDVIYYGKEMKESHSSDFSTLQGAQHRVLIRELIEKKKLDLVVYLFLNTVCYSSPFPVQAEMIEPQSFSPAHLLL